MRQFLSWGKKTELTPLQKFAVCAILVGVIAALGSVTAVQTAYSVLDYVSGVSGRVPHVTDIFAGFVTVIFAVCFVAFCISRLKQLHDEIEVQGEENESSAGDADDGDGPGRGSGRRGGGDVRNGGRAGLRRPVPGS